MKKLNITKTILWCITGLGGILVGQGLITGEELSSIQSISGIVLGGGGITTVGILTILQSIPTTAVDKGYDFLVNKYGQSKVDGIINNFDNIIATQDEIKNLLNDIKQIQEEDRETRNNLLNG